MCIFSKPIKRRTVLSRSAKTVAAVSGTALSASVLTPKAEAQSQFPLDDLHIHAAMRAKALRGERSVDLKLLLPLGCEDNVEPLAREFSEMTGIEITIEWVEVGRVNHRLMLDFLTRSSTYDVVLPASFGIPDLASAGIILNLTPFIERYEPAELLDQQLYDASSSFDGKPFGYQTDGDVYVMFYNRPWLEDPDNQARFLDRYGYPLKIAQTWRELDAQMAFFHKPASEQYGGAMFRNPGFITWEWWIRFHAKGGKPLTSRGYPAINSQKGVDALIEMMSATRYQHPECRTAGLFRNWAIFDQGNCFANIGWGGTQKYLNRSGGNMRDKLAFGPTPGEMINGQLNKVSYFNWGWDYAVSSYATEPELAYLFALFASSPTMTVKAVRGKNGFFDPFLNKHYDDKVIREIYSDAFLNVHHESLRTAIPDFYVRGHGDYMNSLQSNMSLAIEGVVTPAEALENAANEWRLIGIEKGRGELLKQWTSLQKHYETRELE